MDKTSPATVKTSPAMVAVIVLTIFAVIASIVSVIVVLTAASTTNTITETTVQQLQPETWLNVPSQIIENAVMIGGFEGSALSISADGKRLAVGIPGYNSNAGAVAIYNRASGTTWDTVPEAILSDGVAGEAQGTQAVKLSADGNMLVCGSYNFGFNTGRVFVYVRDSLGAWTLETTLSQNSASSYEGYSVAVSDDKMTIAASSIGTNAFAGRVLIYTKNPNSMVWNVAVTVLTQSLANGLEGYVIALSGDGKTLLAGAPGANSNSGLLNVYRLTGSIWAFFTVLTQSVVSGFEGASISLSSDGNTIASGIPGLNSAEGGVVIYKQVNLAWLDDVTLSQEVPLTNEGGSVALSANGRLLAVSCPSFATVVSTVGRVILYERILDAWSVKAIFESNATVTNVNMPVDIASTDGNVIAVGASTVNSNTGRVSIYSPV